MIMVFFGSTAQPWADDADFLLEHLSPVEMHGFLETRAGIRTQRDPHEQDISVMEARFQGELSAEIDAIEGKYKGDAWSDAATEKHEYETREAWCFARPSDFLDLKIGRQVLTWGTGDLVFLNDMFPKDWQSYFIGREKEYLKAPSDAAKISLFTELASMDMVYTPKFDPDRFVTGEYLSSWNEELQRLAGRDAPVVADKPERWFEDDEVALRLYGSINNYELALYGYWGFWKQPGGKKSGRAIFPPLHVYGVSARGQVGSGIGNIELAYYQSVHDESGRNPWVNNSELRTLIGYTRDLAKELNASLQYYVEYMLDYDESTQNLAKDSTRDQDRHVITLQLTKLLMNQNLELTLAAYFSPSDLDAYFRPTCRYTISDRAVLEGGVNLFFGENTDTFFGQFEKNTNSYMALRYSF